MYPPISGWRLWPWPYWALGPSKHERKGHRAQGPWAQSVKCGLRLWLWLYWALGRPKDRAQEIKSGWRLWAWLYWALGPMPWALEKPTIRPAFAAVAAAIARSLSPRNSAIVVITSSSSAGSLRWPWWPCSG